MAGSWTCSCFTSAKAPEPKESKILGRDPRGLLCGVWRVPTGVIEFIRDFWPGFVHSRRVSGMDRGSGTSNARIIVSRLARIEPRRGSIAFTCDGASAALLFAPFPRSNV